MTQNRRDSDKNPEAKKTLQEIIDESEGIQPVPVSKDLTHKRKEDEVKIKDKDVTIQPV